VNIELSVWIFQNNIRGGEKFLYCRDGAFYQDSYVILEYDSIEFAGKIQLGLAFALI